MPKRRNHLSLVPPMTETLRRDNHEFVAVKQVSESASSWLTAYFRDQNIRPIADGTGFLDECRDMTRELEQINYQLMQGVSSVIGNFYEAGSLCDAVSDEGVHRLLYVLVTPVSLYGIVVHQATGEDPNLRTAPTTIQLSFQKDSVGETDLSSWVSAYDSGAVVINVPEGARLPAFVLSPSSLARVFSGYRHGEEVFATVRLILDLGKHPEKWSNLDDDQTPVAQED